MAEYSKIHKGRLFISGMKEMAQYIPGTEGAVTADWHDVKVRTYLAQVLFVQHPMKEIGMRNYRRIQTIGLILDQLMAGDLSGVADTAMQRLKAFESAIRQGSWNVAQHHEVIPKSEGSLVPVQEQTMVEKAERRAQRLAEGLEKAKARTWKGNAG